MRWCTDRLKIKPTGRYIRDTTSMAGGSVLLLGVRSAESSARAQSIEKHGRARLNDHGTVKGCQVYRPIADLSTDAVWAYLLQNRPPWGGSHRPLATLYRNALGGECPFVVDANDAPSCGESGSSRFGCWTCTVVDKDRSLANMVANGFEHLEPLVDYRDWIKEISSDPTKRMRVRRNGEPGLGPFTVEVRRLMLDRLLAIQAETGVPLISADDVAVVRSQWAEDESTAAIRKATILLSVMSNGADDDGWEPCAE
jgi:DNA sulfur modification protein DndC